MNASDCLNEYYQRYDEEGRLLSRPGRVEFETTMRCIRRYLKDGARIIEIGAGTGRYSHALARMGYPVDAVELVQHNIDQFNASTQAGERVTIRQGSACDLSAFPDNTYDVTLLLGPMYHLFTEAEKVQALSEAVRVTKKGGVIFAAYCMADPSILMHGFMKGNIRQLMADGMLDPDTFKAYSKPSDLFELHRVEDIIELRSRFDVAPLHLIATDGYAHHMRDVLEAMDEETFAIYLRYHFATCERPDLLGLSNHTLDIFRKQ
ncbi:MAG: methyltransferase domain-containing protein [Clostridia bacterium]|nr:methyltransferase domain-containing protein [Clostridia bacterium]